MREALARRLLTIGPDCASKMQLAISESAPVDSSFRSSKTTRSTRALPWICLAIALVAGSGAVFALWLRTQWVAQPDPRNWFNAFFVVFARHEPIGLLLVAVFNAGAALFFLRARRLNPAPESANSGGLGRVTLILVAGAVFAFTALGTRLVCHDYALSADEFMADFQARIFMRGKISAEVSPQWVPVVRTIIPTFVEYLPATHSWKPVYLPIYAAMRAIFQSVYLESFLNPLLAAVSVPALFGAVRNIWPDRKGDAFVGAALLATSSQFLVTAMTWYSMPAHLALNAIWLWLYSRPDRRRFYLAPVVGVLAIGLHQPIVHALFVAPFLVRIVFQRRWRTTAVFGLIYLAGCAGWFAWRVHYSPPTAAPTGSFFRLWNPAMVAIQPMDFLLVLGWSSLATPLLAALGLRRILKARPIVQDAALSCLLTFVFYYFFYLDQGYGWGYRYFHGTLACFILLAVAGWQTLVKCVGAAPAKAFLSGGLFLSLGLLTLRCVQAESVIRPFARASAAIHSMNVEVVGVNPYDAWYSADLIRNDPFLENRPKVTALLRLSLQEVDTFSEAGTAHFVSPAELQSLGLATTTIYNPRWDSPGRKKNQP